MPPKKKKKLQKERQSLAEKHHSRSQNGIKIQMKKKMKTHPNITMLIMQIIKNKIIKVMKKKHKKKKKKPSPNCK